MTILDEILANKRAELLDAKRVCDEREMAERADVLQGATRGFRSALANAQAPAIIAEIKRRSPSKGEIRKNFEPVQCACEYAEAGAAALSVLTDERYFGGRLSFLARIREEVSLPLLRKDFVFDAYQIDEARVAGADAVLLIAATLPDSELGMLYERAHRRGLDALVEVHDEAELVRVLRIGADLVGVNNRDLRSFEVDLGLSERLAVQLPADRDVLLVAESGIASPEDVRRLEKVGARAFLVGESLMREPDLGRALRQLRRSQ